MRQANEVEISSSVLEELPPQATKATREPEPSISGTSPAEALRPRLLNLLLWRSSRETRRGTSPSGGIRANADRRVGLSPSDDWTFGTWTTTDAGGLRWGAAPGVIYLAGIAVPICGGRFDASDCGFGVAPGRRDQYKVWLRAVTEIQRQELFAEIMERTQEIQERRAAQRDTTRKRRKEPA